MIRFYNEKDISYIEKLGNLLHNNYKFNLNIYSKCLIIEHENKVIGFVTYSIMYDKAEILDIIVDPLYRKKGYGNELINNVIKDCVKNNCDSITLEVNEINNQAISFYKKIGFKVVAKRKHYYKYNDAYLMSMEVR